MEGGPVDQQAPLDNSIVGYVHRLNYFFYHLCSYLQA